MEDDDDILPDERICFDSDEEEDSLVSLLEDEDDFPINNSGEDEV